jgi:MFS family permease
MDGAAATGRPAPTPTAEVLRARRMLLSLYFLTGIAVATWLSRLPSITALLDLSSAELGSVLLVGSLGSFAMVLAAGALASRWGSRKALLVAAGMFSFANVLVGLGPVIGSVTVLAVGVLISSSSYALANVPMNLETVIVERGMGRSVVPQFHAAFSIGSMTGSLLGAAASWAGVTVFAHFLALSAVTLAWRLAVVPHAVLPVPGGDGPGGAPAVRPGLRTAFAAWREPRTLVIGVIVMTGVLAEGSANNWLTVAVVDGFRATEAVAAVVLGVFTGSMTLARLAGTRVIDVYGRVRVLVASSAASLVGVLLFALGPSLATAVLGAVGWGLGVGLVFPIGVAAVSGDRARMAGRVAVLSAFGSVASIVAPPLLGAAGEIMGIRHALVLIVGGFVVAIALARTVGPDAGGSPAAVENPPASGGTR